MTSKSEIPRLIVVSGPASGEVFLLETGQASEHAFKLAVSICFGPGGPKRLAAPGGADARKGAPFTGARLRLRGGSPRSDSTPLGPVAPDRPEPDDGD